MLPDSGVGIRLSDYANVTYLFSYFRGYFINQYQHDPHNIENDNKMIVDLKNVIQRLENDLVNNKSIKSHK